METEQSVLTRSWSLLSRAVRRGRAAENRSDFETGLALLRLAIVSTPRSGNTWLRHMLSSTFAMHELDRHRPSDVPWHDLPERCVLQIHWLREAPFASLLERHSFRVVTLARHPLDMLISLLHWVVRCPHPESVWTDNPALGGDRGTEVLLLGASPTSEAFLAWACSPRAVALLSVSLQWWDAPGCIGLRYEDLVRCAPDELRRIAGQLGVEPSRDPAEVAAAHTMDRLRDMQREPSQHYWQGQPGLWRRLLPAAAARRIAAAHSPSFARFGYVCDPDETLSRADAAAAWRRLLDG